MTRLAVFTLVTAALVARPPAPPRQAAPASPKPSGQAGRENAYRANNIGVAYLEQYNFAPAVSSFREALKADPALAIARLNLGIALFYGGESKAARTEL